MSFSFKVEGLKDLEFSLKELAHAETRRVIRAALREAAKPIEEDIRANIRALNHVDTGHMLENVRIRISTSKKAQRNLADVSALVGVWNSTKDTPIRYSKKAGLFVKRPPAAVVANWIEHGVEPHSLLGKKERKTETKGRRHPGVRPSPFIAPALATNKARAVSDVKTVLAEKIHKILAKKARKQGGGKHR